MFNGELAQVIPVPQVPQAQSPASGIAPVVEQSIVIAASGRWFVLPDGSKVECRRSRVLHVLLAILARAWLDRPGQGVPTPEIIDAIWPPRPGERSTASDTSAVTRNRLRVAAAKLRKMGLGRVVIGIQDAYLLDPEARLVVAM